MIILNSKPINKFLSELPEQTFICELHGEFLGKPMRWNLGTEKIFEPLCPLCEKEREENEREHQEKFLVIQKQHEEAAEKDRHVAELKKMNVGKKFWEESFDTFNPYTDELKQHFNTCISFASDPQDRMLVMIGNNGNGKDHLAAAILKKIGGFMYSVFELELLLKRSYTGKTSEWALFQRLTNAPLLVINEIGRHKTGKWELDFLSHIVNKRYENVLPIIFVSNKHLINNCQCENCLENYIGSDITSRIIECGEIMEFTGADYRYKKRELRSVYKQSIKNPASIELGVSNEFLLEEAGA